MNKHRGQIVEKIIRKSGYPLATLAKRLYISRNTLYKRFKDPNVSYDFILGVGYVIGYDFSTIFPALEDITATIEDKIQRTKDKYIKVLEKYSKLMVLAAMIVVKPKGIEIRNEVINFLKVNKYKLE